MWLGSCTGRVVGRVVNVCRCKGGQGEQAVVGVASKRAGVGKCNNNTPATTPTAVKNNNTTTSPPDKPLCYVGAWICIWDRTTRGEGRVSIKEGEERTKKNEA